MSCRLLAPGRRSSPAPPAELEGERSPLLVSSSARPPPPLVLPRHLGTLLHLLLDLSGPGFPWRRSCWGPWAAPPCCPPGLRQPAAVEVAPWRSGWSAPSGCSPSPPAPPPSCAPGQTFCNKQTQESKETQRKMIMVKPCWPSLPSQSPPPPPPCPGRGVPTAWLELSPLWLVGWAKLSALWLVGWPN